MKTELTKEQWIEEVYQCLCKSQGAPENLNEEKNLREWASSLADDECNFYAEGYTPRDAHDEEMSNA
jgi:hypothetical protein